MDYRQLLLLLAALPLVAGAGSTSVTDSPEATYEVTVERTWSRETHPLDWPGDAAHFSPGVGATHDRGYTMFGSGRIATRGLEVLSQQGRTSPFDGELAAAGRSGPVGTIFTLKPIRTAGGKSTARFTATDAHPLVSLAAMVAPSPDWFTGVSALRLKRDGKWIDAETITLYAWDSGTNDAVTYTAPKIAVNPFLPIALNAAPMFVRDGKPVPVGSVTLRRVSPE
jgi:hypothetical protein